MIKHNVLRVQKYLDRLSAAKGYDRECIHSFLEGADAETSLLVSDLKALCQFASSAIDATNSTKQGLEQFIEQVGDVHFQRCRVGSKEGEIRWDIEFGHYGDEVRGKTLREAITKAITTQAKKEGEKK